MIHIIPWNRTYKSINCAKHMIPGIGLRVDDSNATEMQADQIASSVSFLLIFKAAWCENFVHE